MMTADSADKISRSRQKRSPLFINPLSPVKVPAKILKYAVRGGLVLLFPPAWKKLPVIMAKKLKALKKAAG